MGLLRKVSGEIADIDRVVRKFYAYSAITIGDWVSFVAPATDETYGMGGSVQPAPVNTESAVVAGVALNSAAAGEFVDVCVYGPVDNANVATSVAAGPLEISGAAAGRAIAHTDAVSEIGWGMETAASDQAAVFVKCM